MLMNILIATILGVNPPGDFPPEIAQFGFLYRIVIAAQSRYDIRGKK